MNVRQTDIVETLKIPWKVQDLEAYVAKEHAHFRTLEFPITSDFRVLLPLLPLSSLVSDFGEGKEKQLEVIAKKLHHNRHYMVPDFDTNCFWISFGTRRYKLRGLPPMFNALPFV